MATVYRAYDSVLDCTRAIKVLAPDYAANATVRERFVGEARTSAKLHHPNIVTVHDIGSDGEQVFIVMELILGGSLRDRVVHHGPLPPRLACIAMIPVLRALHFAHGKGVIHRDMKPHNVMLTEQHLPKITDFGIAHQMDKNLTRTGAVMGTWAYMAPEQRASARKVDGRSDVYASAATLYHLLTDKEPVDLFVEEASGEAFEGLPDTLVEILKRGTQYNMDKRFGSAAAMADALEQLVPELDLDPAGTPPLAVGSNRLGDEGSIESMPLKDPRELSNPSLVRDHTIDTESLVNADGDVPPLSEHGERENEEGSYVSVTAQEPRREVPAGATLIPGAETLTTEGPTEVVRTGPPWAWIGATVAVMVVLGLAAVWWMGPGSQTEVVVAPKESATAAPAPAAPNVAPAVAPAPAPVVDAPAPVAAAAPAPAQRPPRVGPRPPAPASTSAVTAAPAPASTAAPAPAPAPAPAVAAPAPAPAPAPAATSAPEPAGPSGTLVVEVRPGGSIAVDGTAMSGSRWSGKAKPGPHTVLVTAADGTTKESRVPVYVDQTARFCWDFASGAKCQ